MLELSKKILEKVSFDKSLFRKELKKAIKWIQPTEKTVLKVWCMATFGNEFQKDILDVFNTMN